MSSKKFSLFSGIIILLYAGAVLYFLGGLVVKTTRGASTSEEYFEQITIAVEQLHETEPLLSAGYIAELKKLTDTTPYVQAILLKKDAVPFLAYPTDSGLIKQDENHIPVISTSSPVIKMHTKTVSLGTSGTITITAAVSTITKETVWNLAVRSFIVILITTLIVIGHIISERRAVKTGVADTAKETAVPEKKTAPYVSEVKEETSEPVHEQITEPVAEAAAEIDTQSAVQDEQVAEPDVYNKKSDIPAEPVETVVSEPAVSESTDPMGIFSPDTGFCKETYLPMRLESELARSASQEEDLAVFHIRLEGIPHSNPQLKPFCEQLLQFFQLRDLIFNAGSDGYICVVPNISIDGAMNASEKLYSLLQNALDKGGISAKIVIGISTRSMRIVSASRILTEASAAAAHGLQESEMPIVAFRVNQEKYKEYLTDELQKVPDVETLLQTAEELD